MRISNLLESLEIRPIPKFLLLVFLAFTRVSFNQHPRPITFWTISVDQIFRHRGSWPQPPATPAPFVPLDESRIPNGDQNNHKKSRQYGDPHTRCFEQSYQYVLATTKVLTNQPPHIFQRTCLESPKMYSNQP
ncbi:hypothetical protein V6Z11_A05G321700 [Gossypium hirsutum]